MKRKLTALVIGLALFAPSLASATDWLKAQEGPVPVCVGFGFGAVLAASEQHSFKLPVAILFPANTASVLGHASGCTFVTAATGSSAFLIKDCDTSGSCTTKATFTVGSSANTCSMSTQGAFTIAQNHLLVVLAPSSPDATLANGSISICGTR